MPGLALLLLLTLATPAHAEDACLAGDATLGDQRALATLRTRIEETCPCARYTGARGRTRSAYQRCARGVLQQTLTDGTVRPVCRRTATDTNHGAACGSRKSAPCGAVRQAGVTCRIKTPARCRDRRTVAAETCTAQSHCTDVVTWTAGTCTDVRAPGPYAAGVRVLRFTKKSVVAPGVDRVLDTTVWYPAPRDTPGAADPFRAALLDAPVAPDGGPYPLLMFSHGSCGYPEQSTFLTPLLASHGFIVVAPPHPGNTIFDGVPACSAALGDAFNERPPDVLFALDQMLAANADAASPFFQTIDATRLGMSGHSFGGMDTYRVVALDARFKVALPLAPAVFGSPMLAVPSLTMFGAIDARVPLAPIRAAYGAAAAPKFQVEIAHAGHYAFSDLCFPSPDCMPPTTLAQDEAHAAVLRWVLPFLKVHLAGDTRFSPFLTTTPPGVTVERAP